MLHALRPSGATGDASHIDAVARWLLQSQHATHSQGASLAPVTDSRLDPPQAAVDAASAAAASATPPQSPAQPKSRAATPGSEPATPPTGGQQPAAEQPAAQPQGAGEAATTTAASAASPAKPSPQAARAQFPDAITAFTAAARRHADRVGAVHLAMHARDGSLVTAWHQRLESVAEPGLGSIPRFLFQLQRHMWPCQVRSISRHMWPRLSFLTLPSDREVMCMYNP